MELIRVQRKRTKGFKLPPNTICVNRGTKWGNPFRLTPDGWIECYSMNRNILNPWILWSASGGFDTHDVVDLYEKWLSGELRVGYLQKVPDVKELKGKNLACFCPLDKPCHAETLLKLANQ